MDLSHVPRWCTHPVTRPQSVAEHSFRVAVIARELVFYLREDELVNDVILWSIEHDAPESKTGDMPRPFKTMVGREVIAKLEIEACSWFRHPPSQFVADVVSLADAVEALSWICTYGNGLKDKFTYEGLENQLRRRVYTQAEALGNEWVEALSKILAEVAP